MIAGDIHELFDLLRAGENEYVGIGHEYPWGGLYGGHIVAQALRAAGYTVSKDFIPHSLRAYFIRRGEHKEVVRYDVDRIRDGKSFATRRVVANQPGGAILNLEASFHRGEDSLDISTIPFAMNLPSPDSLESDAWSKLFDRRWIPQDAIESAGARDGAGRLMAWMKTSHTIGDDPLLQACALAYLSDDLPTDAAIKTHPELNALHKRGERFFNASLDHSMWFHRTIRADDWHLHDISCHSYVQSRGLSIGHIHDQSGQHMCTVAQESLTRIPSQ